MSQHTCEGIVEEHARWVVVDGQAWSLRTKSSPAVGACVQVVDLGDDEVTGRWLGYSFPASSDKRGGR